MLLPSPIWALKYTSSVCPVLPIVAVVDELDEPDEACRSCGGHLEPMAGRFEEADEIDVIE